MGIIRCSYCGEVHLRSEVCEAKRRKRSRSKANSRYDKQYGWIYRTNRWEFCKDIVMTTQVKCQRCGKIGEQIHHIIPLSKDISRAYDLTNLMLVCQECHSYIHRNNLVLDCNFDVEYWIKKYKAEIERRNAEIS